MATSTTGPQSSGPQEGSSEGVGVLHECTSCNRVFPTARGLGVHFKRAHPVQANAAINVERVKRRWNEEEMRMMAKYEATAILLNIDNINQHLISLIPDRTLAGIKGKRRDVKYKLLVEQRLAELRNAELEDVVVENHPSCVPCVEIETTSISPREAHGRIEFERNRG